MSKVNVFDSINGDPMKRGHMKYVRPASQPLICRHSKLTWGYRATAVMLARLWDPNNTSRCYCQKIFSNCHLKPLRSLAQRKRPFFKGFSMSCTLIHTWSGKGWASLVVSFWKLECPKTYNIELMKSIPQFALSVCKMVHVTFKYEMTSA